MDITYVVESKRAVELISTLDTDVFHNTSINDNIGEFTSITISLNDGDNCLYVEDVYNSTGVLKYHDTDILELSSTLPSEIYNHFENVVDYQILIKKD